eukprot:5623475-Pyramimonas_sp.AAC.1
MRPGTISEVKERLAGVLVVLGGQLRGEERSATCGVVVGGAALEDVVLGARGVGRGRQHHGVAVCLLQGDEGVHGQ